MDNLLYQITVKGRVQGVWFRKYTLEKAQSIGLTGFVKNDLEGTVHIEAEGNEEQLNAFVKWLYRGSPLSKVTTVDYEEALLKDYDTFGIRS